MDLELVRKSVDMQVVFTNMVNEEIGYINVAEFSNSSIDEFQKALETMEDEKAKGVIIDLRGTPGGNISQACKVADSFLEAGEICSSMGRDKEATNWNSTDSVSWDKPVVIIVDREAAGVAGSICGSVAGSRKGDHFGRTDVWEGRRDVILSGSFHGDMVKLVTAGILSAIRSYADGGRNHAGRGDQRGRPGRRYSRKQRYCSSAGSEDIKRSNISGIKQTGEEAICLLFLPCLLRRRK